MNENVADARVRVDALSDSAAVDPLDVAALLGCCVDHVGRLVKRGALPPPYRLGALRRWHLGTLRAFLRARAEAAAAPAKGGAE